MFGARISQPPSEAAAFDPAPSRAELAMIRSLSPRQVAEIDLALRANLSTDWRRLSRVVAATAFQFKGKLVGVPRTYYAMRLEAMVLLGQLQAQGNPRCMNDCHVRWPVASAQPTASPGRRASPDAR